MQPYFFPYLGHFALIASVDQWVVFDVTQYTPKSWMNRNRVLHPTSGWQYVTIPLANSSISIKTFQAKVLDINEAKRATIAKLQHYKKSAPYFDQTIEVIERSFGSAPDDSLTGLNVSGLRAVCDYLKIPLSYRICSELALDYPSDLKPGEWAPHICQSLGATEYVNPVGGREIFDPATFRQKGVSLYFVEFEEFKYATRPYAYEPNLSVLDVMMWNAPEKILEAVTSGTTLIEASGQGG